jgi:hypothetical protein
MTTDQYPRRNSMASFRQMGDEGGLVVMPDRNEVKVLNPVGIKVFSLLDGAHSEAQLAEAVADEFEIGLEQASEDVALFLGELRRNGMLVDEAQAGAITEEAR